MSAETSNPTEPTDAEQTTEAAGDQSNSPEIKPWEVVGRTLLRARLERLSEETVRDAFRQATSRLADGDKLTEDDISGMYHAIEDAKRAVELAAAASPETAPAPDIWEFLSEENKQAYVEEVERRGSH